MRKRRMLRQGARYQILARVNHGDKLLSGQGEQELFSIVLRKAKEKYPFYLYVYCVLANQVKIIIEPKAGTDLSKLVQWILSVFAVRYNHLHKIYGHFWYDRFKSRILDDIQDFMAEKVRIIDLAVQNGMNVRMLGILTSQVVYQIQSCDQWLMLFQFF